MTATTIRRTSGSLILGLGILASAAQVAAKDEEDLDAAYNNGSVGSEWFNNVSIGGYGELHLNLNQDDDNEIDFHRWVLFINHRFSDKINLYSEFELVVVLHYSTVPPAYPAPGQLGPKPNISK